MPSTVVTVIWSATHIQLKNQICTTCISLNHCPVLLFVCIYQNKLLTTKLFLDNILIKMHFAMTVTFDLEFQIHTVFPLVDHVLVHVNINSLPRVVCKIV